MARKEFRYRGKTLEELSKMTLDEFAKYANSRAKRTITRQKKQYEHLLKKIKKYQEAKKSNKQPKPIRTHWRDLIIIPQMLGCTFAIYNGKEFSNIEIKPEMLGHFLGEFALTRKKLVHGKAGIGATRSSTAIAARK
ncbi:MAG: 30S ribosomal protein S19 [Candidatus Diapherotrites archaeon]